MSERFSADLSARGTSTPGAGGSASPGRSCEPTGADSSLTSRLVALRADLDAEYARTVERVRLERLNYAKPKERDGKHSGWRQGQPQCPTCRTIIKTRSGWCDSCRTFAGVQSTGRG